MYQAGAVAVILGGRLDPKGFMDWGARVDTAMERSKKPVEAILGAKDEASGPIKRFVDALLGAQDTALSLQTTVDESMVGIGRSVAKAAGVSDESLTALSGSLKKTAGAAIETGDSFKEMSTVVGTSTTKASEGVARMADETTVAKNKIIRANEEIAASAKTSASEQRKAAVGPVGPFHPGGGGPGGGGGGRGPGGSSEEQAKRTTAAWKEGFNTLANVGKWTTISILGVGAVSVKWASDFQRQMELIRTQVGYSQKDVESFKKSVLDLAPAMGVAPTELAKGLYHVTSVLQGRGGTTEAMNILKFAAEGAKVGMANMEDVSSALMAIFRSAPRDIHSVQEAMGVMNDIVGQGNLRMEDLSKALSTGVLAAAKNAHLGLRDLGAALDTMTSRGIPAEQAATRLRTTLTLMAAPTGKAQKALGELGMSSHQLAVDMQRHGLVYALQDLQNHLDKTFPPGGHLSVEQERRALTKYADALQATGVHGKALETDLIAFRDRLKSTGDSAVQQSQLITEAFGGSRMGTTMALLLQNAGDVRQRFDNLNKANAAGRFQKDWQATQKDFSVQVSQMWAGIQRLGITLGDWLIPKVKALTVALIDAGKWLGHHKVLAEGLAFVFGTVLVAGIAAFFGRLGRGIYGGLADIAKFTKAIATFGRSSSEETSRVGKAFGWLKDKIFGVRKEIEELDATNVEATVEGPPGAGPGGAGGTLGAVGGAIEGMITGVRGTMAPGSSENPLAVVVMASEALGLGARGAGAEAKTLTAEESAASRLESSPGGVILPRGVSAAEAALPAAEGAIASELGGAAGAAEKAAPSLLGRLGGMAGRVGGAAKGLIGAAGEAFIPASIGMAAGGIGQSVLGLRGGSTATLAGGAVGGAIGLIGGPLGAGIGAAIGSAIGPSVAHALGSVLGTNSQDWGKKAADSFSRGFGGEAAPRLKKDVATLIDQADSGVSGAIRESKLKEAGALVAQQLEAGWNQYKFQDEPTMFKQFKAEVKNLPPAAQASAAESAAKFASELEKQGRLPVGSANKLVQQIEDEFPALTKYMGTSAKQAIAAFDIQLDFSKAQRGTENALKSIEGDFPQLGKVMGDTRLSIQQKSQLIIQDLLNVARHGTGPMRKQAAADLAKLVDQADTSFGNIVNTVNQDSAGAFKAGSKNFESLAKNIASYVGSGATATSKGLRNITAQVNQQLKQFGEKPLTAVEVKAASPSELAALVTGQISSATFSQAAAGPGTYAGSLTAAGVFEGGGVLPGSEFGLRDMMTLVDPHGRPRARMAGDEAVFTRHQMPFVDLGLRALGFEGAQDLWSKVRAPHSVAYERGGNLASALISLATGGYIYPFPPGTTVGRTDQGIDANMPVGAPIGPMGDARVVGISPNWYQGQPFIWWQLLTGPRAGRYAYVSEQISNLARPGSVVHANEPIAHYASSGTGIEYGWATSSGQTLARATTGYTEGQLTPAGADMRRFLDGLTHGKLTGGTFGGEAGAVGVPWKNIRIPRALGSGSVVHMINAAMSRVGHAADRYGAQHAGAMTGATGLPSLTSGPREKQVYDYFRSQGFNKIAIAGILGNWMQESSVDPNAPGGGLGQWIGDRWNSLVRLALSEHRSPRDMAVQLQFAQQELRGPYHSAFAAIQSAGSPEQAAIAFSNLYERPGTPMMSNRVSYANQAYAAGFAGGGWLGSVIPGFQTGGNPWSPLPGYTTTIPGFRPIRVRRGRRGLHTVGGGGTRGSAVTGHGSTSKKSGRSGSVKGMSRTKQPISQTTATVLSSLGLGNFAADQNQLGLLDQQYTTQENLFNMFDASGGALPTTDLNVLMGLREQEWDILHGEWKALPSAISALQSSVNALKGHPTHRGGLGRGHGGGGGSIVGGPGGGPATDPATGIALTQKEITNTESDITSLESESRSLSHAITTVHHNASAEAQAVADNYANASATYLNDLNAIADQKIAIAQQKNGLSQQEASITSTGSSGTIPISTIVGQVMSGITQAPSSASSPASEQKHKIARQRAALNVRDQRLTAASTKIRQQMKALSQRRQADARRLRAQGFDEAWSLSLRRWKIQDKIALLRTKLARLKTLLREETKQYNSESSALTQLQGWLTGGLQGNEAIINSLGDIGMDILGLYQEGADLPTPGRSGPTLAMIEQILSAAPPSGLGLTLPAGITQGAAQAAASYQDFLNFQAQRSSLLQAFGSNFVAAGANPFAGSAGVAAGVQYYGAAAGASPGPGAPPFVGAQGGGWLGHSAPGPGGTTINIENHFAAGPPDPHTWAAGTVHELQAQA